MGHPIAPVTERVDGSQDGQRIRRGVDDRLSGSDTYKPTDGVACPFRRLVARLLFRPRMWKV